MPLRRSTALEDRRKRTQFAGKLGKMKALFLFGVLLAVYHANVDAKSFRMLGKNGTTACRKSHYIDNGQRRLCECDSDCNHENNFCAEGLTCRADGVCRNISSQKNCNVTWLMNIPAIMTILGVVIIIIVCVFLYVCLLARLSKVRRVESGDVVVGRAVIDNTTNGYVTSRVDVNIPVARLVNEIELENVRYAVPSTLHTTEKYSAR